MKFKFLENSKKRHLLKSITWRVFGSLDTFLLSLIIFGDPFISLKISVLESFTKLILYYLHERVWFKSSIKNKNIRHAIKPFTWRALASLDTLIISSLFFNDVSLAIQLGIYEIFTKIILYYIHDKVWHRSKYGLNNEK